MSKEKSEALSGFVRLIERQMLLYEERRKLNRQDSVEAPMGPYQFITISRDIGAMGDAVACELAERLKWKVIDKEIVDYIAEHHNVCHELVEQMDERKQNLIHDTVDRILKMFQGPPFSNEEYHVALIKTLATLAAQGRVILLGHGGAFVLKDQPGLHLRVTASLNVRIQRLSKRWGMSIENTRRRVLEVDEQRKSFIQHHFKPAREFNTYFHLVLNTDLLTLDQILTAVTGIMKQSVQTDNTALQAPAFRSMNFESSEQIPD